MPAATEIDIWWILKLIQRGKRNPQPRGGQVKKICLWKGVPCFCRG